MSLVFDMPLRAMTQAEVAEALELKHSGASWVRLGQRFEIRPSTIKACVTRAEHKGFDAWRRP